MSRDEASDGSIASDLPDAVRDWVGERAAEEGLTEDELLARLLAAATDADPARLDERLDDLEATVSSLSSDLDAMIRDVRERVVQVKREADSKAPADHDHPDLEGRLDRLSGDVESTRAAVDAIDGDLEAGFENYAIVLEHLVEATGDIEEKLDLLADALVTLRDDVDARTEERARRRAVEGLARAANRHGARRAACAGCGSTVDIGLLATPECPHCDATFAEFVPKQGLFGGPTLAVGEPPALESGAESAPPSVLDEIFEEEVTDGDTDSERGPDADVDPDTERDTDAGSGADSDPDPDPATADARDESSAGAGAGGGGPVEREVEAILAKMDAAVADGADRTPRAGAADADGGTDAAGATDADTPVDAEGEG